MLPPGQLAAGFIAFTFIVLGAVAVLRYPRPTMAVLLLLLLGFPTIGLAACAIDPGSQPDPGPLLWLAFVPAIGGLVAGTWMLVFMTRRRESLSTANLEVLSNGTLVLYGGAMLALAGFLAFWQPGFAIADVAVNGLWVLLWVPRRLRTSGVESTVEIAAPRARVYSFVVDPANWPRYQVDVMSVAVDPPGRLAPGSRVSVTQRYESGIRGPRLLPDTITTDSLVDAVEPERSISMHIAGRLASTSTTEFADVAAGTRMTTRASAVAPFRMAVFGALVELRARKNARLGRARRNLERLKELLES